MDLAQTIQLAGYFYLNERFAEAETLIRRQLDLTPDVPSLNYNMALIQNVTGNFEQCAFHAMRALEHDPSFEDARDLFAQELLRNGNWLDGFNAYEARFRKSNSVPFLDCGLPVWRGHSDETVLVWCEQGLGDTVQFSRLLREVQARNCKVVFLCQAELIELFVESELADTIFPITQVTRLHIDNNSRSLTVDPSFVTGTGATSHISVMSLARVLKITPETLTESVPFLHVTNERLRNTAAHLRASGDGTLKVGLAWAGSQDDRSAHRDRKSIPFNQLERLFHTSGITFFNFQHGFQRYAALERQEICNVEIDNSFANTAALLTEMDLLITIDSAICHVAGGIGLPVWLLNRYDSCWRWMAGMGSSPWYPNLLAFRQKSQGRWDGVIDEVLEHLEVPLLTNKFERIRQPSTAGWLP